MSGWLAMFVLLATGTYAGLVVTSLLRRQAAGPGRGALALNVHKNRLAQLSRDREAGLIDAREATGAEAEIKRAILAAVREIDAERDDTRRRGGTLGIGLAAGLALALGTSIYAIYGSFGRGDMPLAARDLPATSLAPSLASDHQGTEMRNAIASLRRRLERDPENLESWHLLARSYAAIEAYEPAAAAYRHLLDLAPQALDVRGDYAETLVRKDNGFVGPNAIEQFEILLAHAPKDPRARYYIALRDAQAGNDLKAAQGWAGILRDSPADAPYRPAIRRILEAIIEDAGLDRASLDLSDTPAPSTRPRGPSQADIAAAAQLPEDAQLDMIRGMVARLEERLQSSPEDIEGWLRLASSRRVLGEPAQAIAALEAGIAANPGSARLRSALRALSESEPD